MALPSVWNLRARKFSSVALVGRHETTVENPRRPGAAAQAARSAAPGLPARWRRTTSTSPMDAMASMATARCPDIGPRVRAANAEARSGERLEAIAAQIDPPERCAGCQRVAVDRPQTESREAQGDQATTPMQAVAQLADGGDLTKCSTSTSAGSPRRGARVSCLSTS